jgi:2-oxoisovalerate dehydrogenase E1 component
VLPSNAADAKGLLKSAIRGNNPVLFLEHKGLYRQVFAKATTGDSDHTIPIGKAKVVRKGKDATIVTWGALVNRCQVIAQDLEKQGLEIEVIDLRTILPLDEETIINSVKKTNRLLIAHEDVGFMGFGAEIAARVSESAFEYLDAPIKRVTGAFTPIPHAPALEEQVLPQPSNIKKSILELLEY